MFMMIRRPTLSRTTSAPTEHQPFYGQTHRYCSLGPCFRDTNLRTYIIYCRTSIYVFQEILNIFSSSCRIVDFGPAKLFARSNVSKLLYSYSGNKHFWIILDKWKYSRNKLPPKPTRVTWFASTLVGRNFTVWGRISSAFPQPDSAFSWVSFDN